jgi:hypothetical protein
MKGRRSSTGKIILPEGVNMMFRCVRGTAVLVGAVLSALVLSCCFLAMPAAAQGQEQEPAPVTIVVDGRVLDLDPPAVIVDDRTLVPVAQVAAALQVQVTWDAARRVAVLARGRRVSSVMRLSLPKYMIRFCEIFFPA